MPRELDIRRYPVYSITCVTLYFVCSAILLSHVWDCFQNFQIMFEGTERNEERLQNIRDVCARNNLGMYRSDTASKEPLMGQYKHFFYSFKDNLAWCPIYDANSTYWLIQFADIVGISYKEIKETTNLKDLLRKKIPAYSGVDAKYDIDKTLKFMVVRHPFERLLSAYRTNLESITNPGQDIASYRHYALLGSNITQKYRLGGIKTNIKNILKPNQYIWTEDMQPFGLEPSFKEFVNYIIDLRFDEETDDNWMPYYLFCTPCQIKYDFIAKVESAEEDFSFIKFKSLWMTLFSHDPADTPKIIRNYNNVSNEAKRYFSQLTKEEALNLYEKYKVDFELFQYSPHVYVQYATARSDTKEL